VGGGFLSVSEVSCDTVGRDKELRLRKTSADEVRDWRLGIRDQGGGSNSDSATFISIKITFLFIIFIIE